jgi:hypothetical protein
MGQGSTEFELVRRCARVTPDPTTVEAIRDLVARDLAWDRVVGYALEHATTPLLHRTLSTFCPDAVPAHWLNELAEHTEQNRIANELLTDRLHGILTALADRGIRALPFKGQVLAASAYGDLSLRESGDLDIVIAPNRARDAKAVLVRSGLRRIKDLGWQASFADSDGAVVVDLHLRMSEPRFPLNLGFDGLWARNIDVCVGRRVLPSLGPEDSLLVLCWQLVKDGWDRRVQLARVADIAQMQTMWPAIDMELLAERARRVGARRAVHLALLFAQRTLDAPTPSPSVMAKSDKPAVNVLERRMSDELMDMAGAEQSRRRGQRRFHFLVRERMRDKLFPYLYLPYFWRAYVLPKLTPSERDRATVTLPRALSFLYVLVRPLRVLKERVLHRGPETVNVCRAPYVEMRVVNGEMTLVDEIARPIVTLNPVGALVWEALADCHNPSSLAHELHPQFQGVDREQVERDIAAFVESLRGLGLLDPTCS